MYTKLSKTNSNCCSKKTVCKVLSFFLFVALLWIFIDIAVPGKNHDIKDPTTPPPSIIAQIEPSKTIPTTFPTKLPTSINEYLLNNSYQVIGRLIYDEDIETEANMYSSQIGVTLEKCKEECLLNQNDCFAYQFRSDTNVCNIWDKDFSPEKSVKENFGFMTSEIFIIEKYTTIVLEMQEPNYCSLTGFSYSFHSIDDRACKLRCQNRNGLCFGYIQQHEICYIFEDYYPIISTVINDGTCAILT